MLVRRAHLERSPAARLREHRSYQGRVTREISENVRLESEPWLERDRNLARASGRKRAKPARPPEKTVSVGATVAAKFSASRALTVLIFSRPARERTWSIWPLSR